MATSISVWPQKQIILIVASLYYKVQIATFKFAVKDETAVGGRIHAFEGPCFWIALFILDQFFPQENGYIFWCDSILEIILMLNLFVEFKGVGVSRAWVSKIIPK